MVGHRRMKCFRISCGGGEDDGRCLLNGNGILLTQVAALVFPLCFTPHYKAFKFKPKCWQPIRKSENGLSFLFKPQKKYTIASVVSANAKQTRGDEREKKTLQLN